MSRVYCWQKYEDAKKNGLFEKFEWFWFYNKEFFNPNPFIASKNTCKPLVAEMENASILIYVKPIEQEPVPDLDLLGDEDDE